MDVVKFAKHMYKLIKEREDDISEALCNNTPKDWETYKLMVGEIRGLSYVRNEIKALLETNVDDDEDIISS
jgi:hypothetical protein|tara:strand:+ start:529 stop:741 length:213 start_codon:yes stop_codon:yes gene_type:complete